MLARDIEWIGLDTVALGGAWHGRREVGEFFAEWLDAWEDYDNDVELEEVTPDLIVATSRFRGRGKASGIEFNDTIAQVWEFRDGLAARQTMCRTQEEARRAADLLAQGGRAGA